MGRDCDLRKWIDQGVFRFKDMASRYKELKNTSEKGMWVFSDRK